MGSAVAGRGTLLSAGFGLIGLALLAAAPMAHAATPAPPAVTGTTPVFAGSSTSPSVKGTVDEANTVSVGVYNSNDCTGPAPTAIGTNAEFTAAGIPTAVAGTNHVTGYAAKAFDGPNGTGNASACSPIFKVYTQNPAPVITAVGATISNDPLPPVKGSAGSLATDLRIYNGPNCTGASTHVTREQFLNNLVVVHVQNLNAVNHYSARAVTYVASVEHQASDCSNNFEYTHDDITAAPVPTILGSTPPSGGNDNTPLIYGSAGPGTLQVGIFDSPDCAAPKLPLAYASDTLFASPGIPVQVPDDSRTTFYAAAVDDIGNVTACSASFTYVTGNPPPLGGGGPGPGPIVDPAIVAPKKCKKGRKLKRGKCVKKKKKKQRK